MLADLFGAERRALRDPGWSAWASGASDKMPGNGSNTSAGVRVGPDTALSVSTVYSCVTLRSETMQAMPVRAYREEGTRRLDVPGPRWLSRPNAEADWATFIGQIMLATDLHGDAVLLPVRDAAFRVVEVWVADPATVTIHRGQGNAPTLMLAGAAWPGEWVQVAWQRPAGSLRGVSPVMALGETLGLAVAAQNYGASWFGQGAVPAGVIESDAPEPTPEQIDQIRSNWLRTNGGTRRNSIGILYGGAKFKPITLPPEAAQFLGTRSFSAAELAAAYKIDPGWVGVGVQGSSITYQNVTDQYLALIRRALMAPMRILEDTFSALMPAAQRMRFVPDVFLKPDTAARYATYAVGLSSGFLTVDEVRALEDLPPLPASPAPPEVLP